jgi:hypothetical protein
MPAPIGQRLSTVRKTLFTMYIDDAVEKKKNQLKKTQRKDAMEQTKGGKACVMSRKKLGWVWTMGYIRPAVD